MLVRNNIYNHLSSELIPKRRNNTHKSSELKAVYTNMARYNKKSPLYMMSLSNSKQAHMINIKESALTLRDVVDSFSNTDSDMYSKKMIHSQDKDVITGSFKTHNYSSLPDELDIEIHSLATGQTNTGAYVDSNAYSIKTGSHPFTIISSQGSAHFNLTVSGKETNIEVQNKLAGYINNRAIGINAYVDTKDNTSALILSSSGTGSSATADGLQFNVTNDSADQDIVEFFNMNNVTTLPSDSSFSINGTEHTSSSNNISINQVLELDFHKVSDSPVKISLIPDTEVAMEQIDAFVEAYNNLVDLSESSSSTYTGSRNLLRDISGIVTKHKVELDSAGISVTEDGKLTKNTDSVSKSLLNGDFAQLFNDISTFKEDVTHATERLTLDPMAYINRLIVSYPNTQNKLGSTYTQSVYSGLIYNNYA